MQTSNPFLDDLSRLMTGAAGALQGARAEVETAFKAQMERLIRDLDLVKREEFDAMRDIAVRAADESEALKARVEALEARLARLEGSGGPV